MTPGPEPEQRIQAVLARYGIQNASSAPLGQGLINDTFLVHTGSTHLVLQRINRQVFPEPARIMHNLERLDRCRRASPDLSVRLPSLQRTPDGSAAVELDGRTWRLMEHIGGSRNLASIDSSDQASEVGHALGQFHRLAARLDPAELALPLPELHRTPIYLQRLEQAAAAPVPERNSSRARDTAAAILARRDEASRIDAAWNAGAIRTRVTHGDPKLDNLLFDEAGERALCLIDLDTVQPGLAHHDLADCLRSCCNRRGEGADDATNVRFDLGIAEPLIRAYAVQARDIYNPAEQAFLFEAIRSIPLELAARFLADHLQGDRYFRINEPDQNLHKAEIQLALVADIEQQRGAIEALLERAFGGDGG